MNNNLTAKSVCLSAIKLKNRLIKKKKRNTKSEMHFTVIRLEPSDIKA